MACIEMYKSPDQKGHCPPMSPRLSFSNDFIESHHTTREDKSPKELPVVSSDFEFSVSNQSMTSADQLFFKGRLKPTLRDELLVDDDEDDAVSFAGPKGLPRWKGFLGLKRGHEVGSKTWDQSDGHCTAGAEGKMPKLLPEEPMLQ